MNNTILGSLAAVCLTATTILHPGVAGAAEASLESRLRVLEDKDQIHRLVLDYGLALDQRDFAMYSALFAAQGEWNGMTTNMVPVKGPAAIRATMEKAFAEQPYDPDAVSEVHLVTNIVIDVEGDRGTGYSKYTVVNRNERGEPYVRIEGHYNDVYIREDGRWKFLSRTASRDFPK